MSVKPTRTRCAIVTFGILPLLLLAGCAGFLRFSPEVQDKLEDVSVYFNKYVQGVKSQLPIVLAAASLIPAARPYTAAVVAAVRDAELAADAFAAVVCAGKDGMAAPEEIAAKEEEIGTAIRKINALVGILQSQIGGGSTSRMLPHVAPAGHELIG